VTGIFPSNGAEKAAETPCGDKKSLRGKLFRDPFLLLAEAAVVCFLLRAMYEQFSTCKHTYTNKQSTEVVSVTYRNDGRFDTEPATGEYFFPAPAKHKGIANFEPYHVLPLIQGLVRPPVDLFLGQFGAARQFPRHPALHVRGDEGKDFVRYEPIRHHQRGAAIGLGQEPVGGHREKIGIARTGSHQRDAATVGEAVGGSLLFGAAANSIRSATKEGREIGRIRDAPFVAGFRDLQQSALEGGAPVPSSSWMERSCC
jgi:hypothetical protein